MTEPDNRPLVMVVDDQPANLHLVSAILRHHYQLVLATSGRRALQLAATRCPDLVLLDVHLADQHGYDVCRALKADARTAHAPVLFLTASDDDAHEAARIDAGAVETLSKPIEPELLLQRVAAHLQVTARR